MSTAFAKEALKISVAQICQNIGWHAVQTSPLDILVDVLQRYVSEISKAVHHYSVQYNRTEVNLDDLGLAFQDFSILQQEIQEYANNVDSVPFAYKIVDFPLPKQPNLQIPKPDSRELLMRPDHIPSYLPPLHPDLEEESLYPQQSAVDGVKKNSDTVVNCCDSTSSPLSSPKHGLKRNDWTSDSFNKKSRNYTEEEGRPMREVTSVFLTPTGFVSPVHDGKIADPSLPVLVDSPPPTPEPPPPSTVSSKKDSKLKDVKKDKSSKRKDKEFSKKDSKKLKSSKKEKENKDSSNKHDKLSAASFSSKKEHGSSHKSSKSDKLKSEDFRSKGKDKIKFKSRKDGAHKMKENFKLSKMKAKLKHSGASSSSSHMKPLKLSSTKKLKAARLAKSIKHFKGERTKIIKPPLPAPPPTLVVPIFPKENPCEPKIPVIEPPIEKELKDDFLEDEDMDFREESPEPRLVIDDSLETQARQERESRLEVIDECIEAVIRRGEEESETENKAMDETINAVVRGPPMMMMRKLEPKDIYDFTDASDSSSLSSCDIPPHSPVHAPAKKEKKSADVNKKSSDSPKRSKKEKKKKGVKDTKAKSSSPYSPPPKNQKSSFILKVDDRTPSPIMKDDLLSSDGSTPSSSPRSNSFFDHSPSPQGPTHQSPLLSHIPPRPPPFIPGSNYTASPFASVRPLGHIQTNPHFPTPPLFVTPGKSENGTSFQNVQPLNLAKSGPSSTKSSPEKSFEFSPAAPHSSAKDTSDLIKKAANILEKPKVKERKKDKVKKKGHKESEKVKEKKEKEKEKDDIKEKEVKKPKEKPKAKSEKSTKVEKRKSKPDKKKRDKEEKVKEDSTVPKMTLKLGSGSGSTKIFVKPNTKNSTSLSSSPSPPHDMEDDTPSLPPRVPTPSPPREPTPPPPPPPPRSPTPPPLSPSPPPVVKEVKELSPPPPVPPPSVTKSTHSRGRGRGRKSASAANPPARTVITETVGTIVDESGNKIWICPACSKPDDGSPMIGCDECDDWYHWVCVNIVVPPKDEENWYCDRCVKKRKIKPKDKRRGKKHKKEK